jgi:HSP20 family protein
MMEAEMTASVSKLPVKKEEAKALEGAGAFQMWHPLDTLRREVEHLFQNFERGTWPSPFRGTGFDIEPFWKGEMAWGFGPAVDFVEKDDVYELTAELPGLDDKNIELRLVNGNLVIKGEKLEDKEEKKKGYYLHERHFGSFERTFRVPEAADAEKIVANFKKGVLKVTLPKKPEARKPAKRIEIKAS